MATKGSQCRVGHQTCKHTQRTGTEEMTFSFLALFLAFFWALWPCRTASELIVNVSRNKTHPDIGVTRQSITGNASTETVTLEFKEVRKSVILDQFWAIFCPGTQKPDNLLHNDLVIFGFM